MKSYNTILNILKQSGYDETTNVSDFYFVNRQKIDPLILGPNVSKDAFALQVRWKSPLGIECTNAIKQYFDQKIKTKERQSTEKFRANHELMMNDPDWEKKVSFNLDDFYATIDFSDFFFQFQDRSWNLNQFVYSFETSRIGGQQDLIGIDLSGIKLGNCRLVRLCFRGANFDNAKLFQVELIGTSFQGTSFRNAQLRNIRAKEDSFFNGADFTAAGVFGIIPLSDRNLTEPFRFTEVSYLYLVKQTFKSLLHIKSRTLIGQETGRHTAFANNPTTEMTLPKTRALREYINWYQFTMDKINDLPNTQLIKSIGFLSSVVATKHWTSYWILLFFALFLNLAFTGLYMLIPSHFCRTNTDFMTVFFDSTLIFTSLGLEGIKPITSLGQLLVISEVIFGYIVLALFVFLLARKVEWKY